MTIETMLVDVGQAFSVRLNALATAGYLWTVHLLPEGLEYLGNETEQLLNHAQAGDSMVQEFLFRALKAGEFSIQFNLKRVWETESANTQVVTIKAS